MLLRQYKDLLKAHLRTAYTTGCSALSDILPDSLQSSADKADLAVELQNMYEITVEEVFSKLRLVSCYAPIALCSAMARTSF